jgi:hypothetical protein
VETIIAIGSILIEAKADPKLEHGQFEAMVERDLPFGPRTARMLMAVARDPLLSDRNHGSVLPPSWRTLYELSRLPEPVLEAALADGRITPAMERKQVPALHATEKRVNKIPATEPAMGGARKRQRCGPWQYHEIATVFVDNLGDQALLYALFVSDAVLGEMRGRGLKVNVDATLMAWVRMHSDAGKLTASDEDEMVDLAVPIVAGGTE